MNLKESPAFIPGNTIALADSYIVNSSNDTLAAFFEMDLTDIRKFLRDKRKDGQNVALSAWIVKMVSAALSDQVLDEYPKNFNYDMFLEKEFNKRLYSVPLEVKNVSDKSVEDISREIGFAKGSVTRERNFLKENSRPSAIRHLLYLPDVLRKFVYRLFLRNPDWAYQKIGNSAFSYISTTGKYEKRARELTTNDISLAISSMFQKPRLINYEVKMRDIVPVTILLNRNMLCNRDTTFFIKDLSHHINNNAAFITE